MRVIAGRYGGRRLQTPKGWGTRPTSERVREAVFSMLGDITGARVLDLFAGSGALAIEALSRGAESALMIERDPHAAGALKANLKALGLQGQRARITQTDALAALEMARKSDQTYDLIFIDPPYERAQAYSVALQRTLAPVLAPAARVVSESDRRTPLELQLTLERERRYGDTLIRIHSFP
jgi:16S rRNA (guanine966-N2)-methyltransferase